LLSLFLKVSYYYALTKRRPANLKREKKGERVVLKLGYLF